MPNPDGGSVVGRLGDGYAKVTMIVDSNGNSNSNINSVVDFQYTGNEQLYIIPEKGIYKLEVWGAEGGSDGGAGGKGGYARGEIELNKGDNLKIYVGRKGDTNYGGWNGGGRGTQDGAGGGGATDFRVNGVSYADRVIVAGGGGGSSDHGNDGGYGGGLSGGNAYGAYTSPGATQSSGNALGVGGNYRDTHDAGGGGGGYFGGYGGKSDTGGSGGSSYVSGLLNSQTKAGSQSMPNISGGTMSGKSGNGYARIELVESKEPKVEIEPQPETITQTIMTDPGQLEPPESAYEYVLVTKDPSASVNIPSLGNFTPGNFINTDFKFQVYFPNEGDFYGNGDYGISSTTSLRGKGFVNNMDTTEWTKTKQIKFDFNVIYNNSMYFPGEWIDLVINEDTYDFYVPLASGESMSSLIEFKVIANNGSYLDNNLSTNKVRDSKKSAEHSAIKRWNIDVVGRIGNMVIEDTGDFRFSNFFKQPLVPTQWLIPNVVKRVNSEVQNNIVGDTVDIRGYTVGSSTKYLNTYGSLPFLERAPVAFPLSPEKNNLVSLRKQPMRLGYDVLADIQTIGNYYDNMQIVPYYYSLNLKSGAITPVDIYMDVNGYYKAINKFGVVTPGWDVSSVYQFIYSLDWDNESGRRNYQEYTVNKSVTDYYTILNDDGTEGKIRTPFGSQFPYGTSQVMYLKDRNRTFIGSSKTYGWDKNPGNKLPEESFGKQAQRWHFSYGLPSSTVIVKRGVNPTQDNIDLLRNNTSVIVMAADIKAIGDTYALQYKLPSGNGLVNIAGTSWSLNSIPYPVLSVYSANKSSANDLDVGGTH